MVDTYRASGSQEDFSTDLRSHDAGASPRPAYSTHDPESRTGARRNVDDELRRQRRADLFFEDSVVLLSILLGGAVGYMTATTVRRTTWSSPPTRKSQQKADSSHSNGQQSRSRTARSVETDETTDLIASNKVEGTTVYNRQGEKLGEVYNFLVGKRSGEVAYAIMSFGGFLGIGQKYREHEVLWGS